MENSRIMVVEDNAITRKVMRVALDSAGYHVFDAPDGKTALQLAREKPHLIIQDLVLPDVDGIDLAQQLRSLLSDPPIPIIACTGLISNPGEAGIMQGLFADCLFKPVEPSHLLKTVARYLIAPDETAQERREKRRILLVDDDAAALNFQKLILEAEGFEVIPRTNGSEACRAARELKPDAVLCDLVMPGMNGFDLCMALRKDSELARLPIVITSSSGLQIEQEDRRLAEQVGADAFVPRTADLSEAIEALRRALARASHPQPATTGEALKDEYVQRLFHILERRSLRASELTRRLAEEKARRAVTAEVADILNRNLPLQRALEDALALTLDVIGSSAGAIYLLESDGGFRMHSSIGFRQTDSSASIEPRSGSGEFFRALAENKILTVRSAEFYSGLLADPRDNIRARSWLIAPLVAGDHALGVMAAAYSRTDLDEQWMESVRSVASQLAQAILLARTSTKLAESEQRFRELAENIREIFFVTGPGGAPLQYISPAYEQITGRPCHDLYRDPFAWLANIHSEDRGRIEQAQRTNPAQFDEEYRIVRPDGQIRHLRSRAFPVTGPSGEVTRIVGITEDITAHKQAQAQMQIQSAALASAANGIVITDRDGAITWVNPAFSRLTGYSPTEAIGKNPRLLKSGIHDRAFYENLWSTIQSGSVWSGEMTNRRKDGSLYIEEQSITPVRDENGAIRHFVSINQDITERKRAEEIARQNLDRIHALREIDLAIRSTLDLRTVLTILLEKIELFVPIAAITTVRLYNPQTGELEPLACRGLDEEKWKVQQRDLPVTTGRRVAESRKPLTVRNLLTSPLTHRPEIIRERGVVSYLGVPLIAQDEVLGVLSLYTREEHDFTEEEIEFFTTLGGEAAIAIHNAQLFEIATRIQSGLEISNAYLNRSLRQLSSLYTALMPLAPSESLETMMKGIAERLTEATGADAALIRLQDKDAGTYAIVGQVGFSDEYVKRILTLPQEGAVKWVFEHGEPIICPSIAAEPRFKEKMQLHAGLQSCAVLPVKIHGEVRGVFHLASRKLGYFDEDQKQHLTAIARQMAIALENRELYETLRASRDELKKSNQIKDDFLSVMSHELKTPLVVVIGYTQLLKHGTIGALNEEQQEALDRVLRCAGQQLDIINNILQTIQLGAHAQAPQRQRVDIGMLFDSLKAEYEKYHNNDAVALVWNAPASLRMITDPLQLKQILRNLVNNALKFTECGTVKISARKAAGKRIEFKVKDSGIGIPKEMHEVIFEKFFQLDGTDTRPYGGVGLGLHIVRELTKVLEGEIEVQSEPGKGSLFTLRLPGAEEPLEATGG